MSANDDEMPDAMGSSASAANASGVLPSEHSQVTENAKKHNGDLLYLLRSLGQSNALVGSANEFEDVFARALEKVVDERLPGLIDRKFEQVGRLIKIREDGW